MIRLFVAIPIPAAVKKQIGTACAVFPAEKWTPATNLHLTVHFIGNLHPDEIAPLSAKLSAITLQFDPFTLFFKEVCAISNHKKSMIWIRMQHSEPLEMLASIIAEVTGSEPDFSFTPHITLLRLPKDTNHNKKPNLLSKIPVQPFEMEVKQVELWDSVPVKEGRKYTCLQKFLFGGVKNAP
ncbi:2'-5' RNA ligase [Sphingobacteriales bacterium TSM_CSM]|nr:2'-5' RNA ligase [Sphingobacteriales bacterium TSM_CSM]